MSSPIVATTVPLQNAGSLAGRLVRGRPGLPFAVARDGVAWATGKRALVGWGEFASIRPGAGDSRFTVAARELEEILGALRVDNRVGGPGTGPVAFGSFSFDPDCPDSSIVVPSMVLGCDGARAWVTTIGEAADPPELPTSIERRARRTSGTLSDGEWLHAAAQARSAVTDGILDKVVLARDAVVEGDAAFDPHLVADYLARRYPQCFTYLFDGLVGSSPELLVRRRGMSVASVVLGGSAARGATQRDDNELAQGLLASAKDRIEHDLAVATVRDALQGVCESLSIENEPSLLRLPYVQHLSTRASGRLARSRDSVELAGVLHPTAAVCGVPVDKALAAIRELEGMDRGRYCGPVGWTDASGDGEWAIALRCAQLQGARARIFAGAGIVADSDPTAELAETELKLRPLLEALGAAPVDLD